ncbi:hypothetical protein ACG7TL_001266 [Trametes sanguinea]
MVAAPHHVSSLPTDNQRLETLLSAHSMALPTSPNSWGLIRASAAAALSEVYPRKRVEKALDFVESVRRQLAGRPAAYDHFFKALKLYEEGRVELVDVLLQLMILCAETPSLLLEVNYFLPPGYCYQTFVAAQR